MPFNRGSLVDWFIMGVRHEDGTVSVWASKDVPQATLSTEDVLYSGQEHHLQLSMRHTDAAMGNTYNETLEDLLAIWQPEKEEA